MKRWGRHEDWGEEPLLKSNREEVLKVGEAMPQSTASARANEGRNGP